MGEEVRITDYDFSGGDDDGRRATEWEAGLPNIDDLPPLSQFLISPELALAFNISPEPHRSMTDVTRASHNTLSTLRLQPDKLNDFTSSSDEIGEETVDLAPEGSDSRKLRRVGSGDSSATSSKRIRMVWTPQLHKRFVEVVAHLGVKKAVPKTIMELMNVEGLTRENVASHLQKYRLYVKRSPELSSVLQDSAGANRGPVPVPVRMTYAPQQMVRMRYEPPRMVPNFAHQHGLEYHSHPYTMMMQPKDWSGNGFGFGFGLVSPYQGRMTHNDE